MTEDQKPVDQVNEGEAVVENTEPEVVLSPLEQVTQERDELRDLILRTRAEMDNVRKRMNRERDEERKYASLPVVLDLLPVIDNLGRAVSSGKSASDPQALLQGVEMVAKQLEDVLSKQGLKLIPSVGQPFDPNLHEALQQVPTADHPPMTVIQEFERGFQLHDRVVRPSKVIVSSAPAAQ
ncbi:nucleotide exchange factor GrpE [Planctomicrobium sp. SH668]|uniref:nucleotide exchange factor GrpE n=1 Tax=Planctomicrobium sp. SH668 TaxID=3448126 RepID=UPI003F5B1464